LIQYQKTQADEYISFQLTGEQSQNLLLCKTKRHLTSNIFVLLSTCSKDEMSLEKETHRGTLEVTAKDFMTNQVWKLGVNDEVW
jgi:hypothetical protein